jgi:hypothetical protein
MSFSHACMSNYLSTNIEAGINSDVNACFCIDLLLLLIYKKRSKNIPNGFLLLLLYIDTTRRTICVNFKAT